MIFGPLFRSLQNFLGYVCPAYYTYKTIESKKTDAMLDWAMYWFVLALFSSLERIMDAFLFWLPFYSLGKVLLVVYLWYPGTQGAQVIYNRFIRVNLGKYEPMIDNAISDAKVWTQELYSTYTGMAFKVVKGCGFGVLSKLQKLSAKSGKTGKSKGDVGEKEGWVWAWSKVVGRFLEGPRPLGREFG